MELWIRSQDKKHLLRSECLTVAGENDKFYICDTFIGHIATYKTEKRALEVLDDIQNTLKPKVILKSNGGAITTGDNNLHLVNPTYETVEQVNTYVYEMPKE